MTEPYLLLHLALFGGGALLIRLMCRGESARCRELLAAYVVAYAARVATTIVLYRSSTYGLFFFDDWAYDRQASILAFSSPTGLSMMQTQLGTFHVGYPLVVSWIYSIAGHSILSAEILNAFFAALTAPLAYFIAEDVIPDQRTARIALWTTALFLYDIVWSAFLLKDTILLFLVTASTLSGIKAIKRRSVLQFCVFSCLAMIVAVFRYYAAATLCISWLLAVIAGTTRSCTKTPERRWAVFLLGGVVVAAVAWRAFSWITEYALGLGGGFMDVSENLRVGGYTPLVFSPTLHYLVQLAHGITVYFLGPFPWVFHGVDTFNYIFYPGMYLIYGMMPFFFLGIRQLMRDLNPVGVFIVLVIMLHAAMEIYAYQDAERQRIMTDVLFVTCVAIGWRLRDQAKTLIPAVYVGLAIIMCVHLSTQLF